MNKFLLPIYLILCIAAVAFSQEVYAQDQSKTKSINPALLDDPWPAEWITHPKAAPKGYGVYHLRKIFELPSVPEKFIVHISADNRFRLLVNGAHVTEGPARGDLTHWRFETLDLSTYLKSGKNTIAAVVWNFGEHKALATISNRTAFIMQGDSEAEKAINTDESWKIIQNKAYAPIPFGPVAFHGYFVVGPGEKFDATKNIWDWQKPDYDDGNWESAVKLGKGTPRGNNSHENWLLVQNLLPPMESVPQRFQRIRRNTGIRASDQFVKGNAPIQIPARTKATVLFDNNVNTVAFPELSMSGGKGSTIKISYGEAMFDEKFQKGHRDAVEDRKIFGNYDVLTLDGGKKRNYSTLYYRTFRFVELEIETGDEPLILEDFTSRFTAYPFKENGRFASNDPMLKQIWDIGWRTARLCAYDTYMDTPYYEQLQYVADTRIQALISLYVSGDDRLMRNAIEQLHDSQIPDGLTQSRYPTELPQLIPNFSLFWISMLHDYWRYRSDDAFLRQYLPSVRHVFSWFESRITDKNMIGLQPYWDFSDHSYKSIDISKEGRGEEGMTPNTLLFAYSLRQAADLFHYFGEDHDAERYKKLADNLVKAAVEHTYDEQRKLFADTPAKKTYSQHANIFAVLTDAVPLNQQPDLLNQVLQQPDLVQQTIYFRFYLGQAFKKACVPDRYLENLGPWKDAVALGFTTFPEGPEPTRSDCHAWSASPNYEFLATVCGMEPDSPGFKTIKIAPALGTLKEVEGAMPHPLGIITMKVKKQGKAGLRGEVVLPEGLTGRFIWNGKTINLVGGRQEIKL